MSASGANAAPEQSDGGSGNDESDDGVLARPSRLWRRLAGDRRRRRWLAPAVAVALLVVVGVALARTRTGGGFSLGIDGATRTVFSAGGSSKGAGATAAGPGEPMGPTVALDEFLIQLAPRERDRYVRFALALEMTDEGAREAAVKRMTRIRAAVLETMTDFTPEDLHGSDGVAKLKKQIRSRIRRLLGAGVKDVYLVQFGIV